VSPGPPSLSYRYQQSLGPLARGAADPRLAKRLSELLSLLDFSSTLNRSLELSEKLDLVLLVAMGETAASWAAVALRGDDDQLRVVARRGISEARLAGAFAPPPDEALAGPVSPEDSDLPAATREFLAGIAGWEAAILVPLRQEKRLTGLLALGKRPGGYGEGERAFVEALSVTAAASIENGRIYEELRSLNNRLSLKIYQLNSLFDITRELHGAREAEQVRQVLLASAMGQLLAKRGALVEKGKPVAARGLRRPELQDLPTAELIELERLSGPTRARDVASAHLRERLGACGFEAAAPLWSGATTYGALLVGEKASGHPLSGEDLDFLGSLAAQGAAALENLRLTAEWMEKQRIEKELTVARQIQRALLPERDPEIASWDIAGVNIPCLTVGGDYYDYVECSAGKLGLAVADVSGKGAGPALLMASAQASLRVLSQIEGIPLSTVFYRLNELLFRSTEPSKYVTFFYGLLDPAAGEMDFVNAGHCFPLHFRKDGGVEKLVTGGPVLGLLPKIAFEVGRTVIEPGELLLIYTDGLSEISGPGGEEFGEARIIERTSAARGQSAREIIADLVEAARRFAGGGPYDDLTVVVAKRL
jgi:sigma-B regulation protein RsbU (phosphoserine phosphatase)